MNVGELRAALDAFPDEMKIAVVDVTHENDLDTDPCCDVAVLGATPDGRQSWRWRDDEPASGVGPVQGEDILVFY